MGNKPQLPKTKMSTKPVCFTPKREAKVCMHAMHHWTLYYNLWLQNSLLDFSIMMLKQYKVCIDVTFYVFQNK